MAECLTSPYNHKSAIEASSEHIAYINQASKVQKGRIKQFLINLDKSNRIDPDSKRRNDVLQGVTEIVTDISKKIAEINPLLSGKIVPMGSAHNNTKVGDSNEIDFVFEHTRLIGGATVEGLCPGGPVLKFPGKPNSPFFKPLPPEYSRTTEYSRQMFQSKYNGMSSDVMLLDKYSVRSTLSAVLDTVLSGLKLPDGWQHGGFNRPNFSGTRRNGPSMLLQFDYLNTIDHKPLCISVDFVPMIKLSVDINKPFFRIDLFCTKMTGSQYCWYSPLAAGRVYFSNAEEALLRQYSFNSTVKVLLRVCKVLNGLVEMNLTKYPSLDDLAQFVDVMKQKAQMQSDTGAVGMPHLDLRGTSEFPQDDEYLSYSDLGETVGDECIVKSYDIKRLVLGMMAADESKGKEWTEEDLPDLVMSIYMLIENKLRGESNETDMDSDRYEGLVDEEFTVPLEHLLDLPDLDNADQENPISSEISKLPTEDGCSEPRFYTRYVKIVKIVQLRSVGEWPLVLSKMLAIFQLLRCVCDGKKSANIFALKRIPAGRTYGPLPVTKKDFRDMLSTGDHV